MKTNKSAQVALLQTMIEGIKKHYATVTEVKIAGSSYSPAALAQLLQSLVDAIEGTAAAKTASHAAVLAERDTAKAVRPVLRAFRSIVLSSFSDPKDLADFGLVLRKSRVVLKPEKVVEAVQKAQATRKARHTMGRKQKLEIKGSAPTPANGGSTSANGGSASASAVASATKATAPTGGTP